MHMKNTTNTNKTDSNTTNPTNSINIKKFLINLENIGSEKEKEEFVKNYSKIREEIKIIDDILGNDNIDNILENYDIDEINNKTNDVNDYQTQSINELVKLLELNENKIFGTEDMDIKELKSLINICMVLEKKINNDTMDIIEIK